MPTTTARKITVVTNCAAHGDWLAAIFVGSVLVTQARGRNEECAVADAVAKFRTSRCCRRRAA